MSTLHAIRRVSDIVYELDIEWGDSHVRGWYRMDFDNGIIVPKLPLEFTHLHGWLVRPLGQAFAAYLRGERLEFPIDLGLP